MRVAVLVVSRNRPDLVRALAASLDGQNGLEHDLFVVEAGTDPDKLCEWSSLRYDDPDFRGKCHAHNVALDLARTQAAERGVRYDYYWVLMNDVVFEDGALAMRQLVETMERDTELGILSPTCQDRKYPGSERRPGGGWRPVTTCDYLGFMIRGEVVETIGFLNPAFRYCWGAIHELSHLLHANGWTVAYSDDVEYEHLGGTTYGAAGTKTISREEYQVRAKRFAFAYFTTVYGPRWHEVFWRAAQESRHGARIDVDTYRDHRELWSTAFSASELQKLVYQAAMPAASSNRLTSEPAHGAPETMNHSQLHQLHLGCGTDRREGWVNVDVNERFAPDLVAAAHSLPMLDDGSCAVIEACHLFEHLTLSQARAALREWRRLLAAGGELRLELPDLSRCIELIGTDMDGYDLGMMSLFGYPPEVDEQGEPQLHKWGWTPESLANELRDAGFEAARQEPITQTFRKAAKYDRDMRIVATVAPLVGVTAVAEVATEAVPAPTPQSEQPGPALQAVLAWPRYDDAEALDEFFHVFARVLSGRDDVGLFLRIDPDLDPPRDEVIQALDATHARILGATTPLQIELLEGEMSPEAWRTIGSHFVCRIRSSSEAAPRDAARQAPTPVVTDAAALYGMVNDGRSCGVTATQDESASASLRPEDSVIVPAGAHADPALVERIAELHPWFYPVTLGELTVLPGVGSVCDAEWLANRAACRATLLVEEVLQRVDMKGKSILDLACNCAFWSSHYADAGAASLLGVEGRARHVEQAELYWSRNQFLPEDRYRFEVGNISDPEAWESIRAEGPFDVTLCAGILYHIPNYADVLRWAAEVTNEVLIVDTRVSTNGERLETEPGDLTFNAIAETRDKVVPDRAKLLATLRDLGFDAEVMPVGFERQLGVDDVDSYADGARVTIIARKVKSPARTSVASGSGALSGGAAA